MIIIFSDLIQEAIGEFYFSPKSIYRINTKGYKEIFGAALRHTM
jgi:hypothetical protein